MDIHPNIYLLVALCVVSSLELLRNKAAMNIYGQALVDACLQSLGKYLMELFTYMLSLHNFIRIDRLAKLAVLFCIPTSNMWVFICSVQSSTVVMVSLSISFQLVSLWAYVVFPWCSMLLSIFFFLRFCLLIWQRERMHEQRGGAEGEEEAGCPLSREPMQGLIPGPRIRTWAEGRCPTD